MKRKISLIILTCFCSTLLWSQTRQITGTVTSETTNEVLPGVTISIKGGNAIGTSNTEGKFSVQIPSTGRVVLVVSSVGYTTQEITVGTSNTLQIRLVASAGSLDDVVVIGYQTVRRRDVLASVSSIGAKDLKDVPINSAAEALNGRLAGVTATTSEGSPDADVRIRIRGGMSITGDNSPLYIVDGVQVENALSTVSPQDIQSIDVLKDAAATAIYGARGANGVIVITTKSGRPGRPQVSYNGFVGVRNLARKLDVLSPYEFVVFQAERSRGSGTDSLSFTQNYGTTWDTLNVYKDIDEVDWQRETFGRRGITTTHNVTAAGGNKAATFSVGYTYNNEEAIVINSNYKRHLLNLKGDYKVLKNLKIGVGGRLLRQDVEGAGVSSDRGSQYSRLRNAVKYRPFLSPDQELEEQDPLADPNVGNGLNLYNPITLANAEFRQKTTEAYNINASATYTVFKNVTFRSTFGYDISAYTDRQFSDSITPIASLNGRKPIVGLDTAERKTFTNSNVLSWSLRNWKNKHSFDVLVGEETYDLRTESRSSQFKNYPLFTSPDDAIKNTDLAESFPGYPRLRETRYTNLSFFSRVGYSLFDRYLFSFNIRADGASKFAPDRQWGYFPAASFAWRLNKEKFMGELPNVSELKLRAGFGTVGNNRIDDYLFLTKFSNDGRFYYGINDQTVIGYYPTSLVNEQLTWESTVNKNLGMDLALYNNRFSISLDLYHNTSKDLLLFVPIASTYGYTTQYQNIGKTSNRGIELQLNAGIIQKKELSWNASFNISHNKNSIKQLGVNQEQFYPDPSWGVSGQPTDYLVRVGGSVGRIYGLITDGFYTLDDFNYDPATMIYTLKPGVVSNANIIGVVQPGSIKFKDLNGDNVVDIDDDRTVIGNTNPSFTGGLNQQFQVKRWDASLFVNFSYGNDIYNANKIEMTNAYSANSNLLDIMEDRWRVITPSGQTAQWVSGGNVYGLPKAELAALNANATIWQPLRSTGAFYPHSWAIEDGSFLRINNLTIGYTLPVKATISKLRLYVTANNLAVFTNYSGYDPEVSVRNNPLTPGLDYSAYPKSRTFLLGVNATF